MRRIPILLLAALALALHGCGRSPAEGGAPVGAVASGGVPAARLAEDFAAWPRDPFELIGAVVQGDTLKVDVRYGGGCAEHVFTLLVSPAFMESFPVQVRAALSHDARGDVCRALLERSLLFDLRPLRDAYRGAYGPGPAEVHLLLGALRVSYRF